MRLVITLEDGNQITMDLPKGSVQIEEDTTTLLEKKEPLDIEDTRPYTGWLLASRSKEVHYTFDGNVSLCGNISTKDWGIADTSDKSIRYCDECYDIYSKDFYTYRNLAKKNGQFREAYVNKKESGRWAVMYDPQKKSTRHYLDRGKGPWGSVMKGELSLCGFGKGMKWRDAESYHTTWCLKCLNTRSKSFYEYMEKQDGVLKVLSHHDEIRVFIRKASYRAVRNFLDDLAVIFKFKLKAKERHYFSDTLDELLDFGENE